MAHLLDREVAGRLLIQSAPGTETDAHRRSSALFQKKTPLQEPSRLRRWPTGGLDNGGRAISKDSGFQGAGAGWDIAGLRRPGGLLSSASSTGLSGAFRNAGGLRKVASHNVVSGMGSLSKSSGDGSCGFGDAHSSEHFGNNSYSREFALCGSPDEEEGVDVGFCPMRGVGPPCRRLSEEQEVVQDIEQSWEMSVSEEIMDHERVEPLFSTVSEPSVRATGGGQEQTTANLEKAPEFGGTSSATCSTSTGGPGSNPTTGCWRSASNPTNSGPGTSSSSSATAGAHPRGPAPHPSPERSDQHRPDRPSAQSLSLIHMS